MQTLPVEASDTQVLNEAAEPITAAGDAPSTPATTPKSRKIWSGLLGYLGKKIISFWKVAAGLVVVLSAAATLVVACYIIFISLTQSAIVIEPLSTPKSLVDNGYTPEVAAAQLQAALGRALSLAQLGGPQMILRAEQPDITVPSVGISAQTIANSIRKFLPKFPPKFLPKFLSISSASIISGEFTVADGKLWLSLRSSGRDIYSNARGVSPEQVRQLMDAAAPAILRQIWPIYLVLTSYRRNPDRALEAADQIIATASPSDAREAYILKGMIYLDQKKFRQALASFTSALEGETELAKRALAYIGRGWVFKLQKKFKQADQEFSKAEQLSKDDSAALMTLRIAQGFPLAAAAEVRKMTKKNALDPGVHDEAGNIFFQLGMTDEAIRESMMEEAIREYREAIRIDPDDIIAHINLGTAYSAKKQMEDAAASYRKAIDIDPQDERVITARMALGEILRDQDRFEEAAAEFQKAVEMPLPTSFLRFGQGLHQLAPSEVDNRTRARNALGAALRELGKLDEAKTVLTENIEFEPRNAEAHAELGLVLRDQEQFEDAVAEFRKAIQFDRFSPAAHFNLATLLRDQGKPDEAIAEFRDMIGIWPDDAQAHRALAMVLFDEKKPEDAISELQESIRLNANDPFTRLNLGIVLQSQGKDSEAIASLGEAVRLGPEAPEPHRELAAIYKTQDRLDEAIVELRVAITKAPDEVDTRVELASILSQRGDLDGAVAEFREVLKRDSLGGASQYNLATALTTHATQKRSGSYVAELVEACQLLVEGKRLAPTDPDFAPAIKRVDQLMPRHHHCSKI
jgi:tetratricopeptide (TPR) repeat protein